MRLFNIIKIVKKQKFTITENVLASQGQRFLNVIIDLVFIYILILSERLLF
jgi:hypothetical protein